ERLECGRVRWHGPDASICVQAREQFEGAQKTVCLAEVIGFGCGQARGEGKPVKQLPRSRCPKFGSGLPLADLGHLQQEVDIGESSRADFELELLAAWIRKLAFHSTAHVAPISRNAKIPRPID